MDTVADKCQRDKQQKQADEEGKNAGEEYLAETKLGVIARHVPVNTFSKRFMNSRFFCSVSKFDTRVDISRPWTEVR